MMTPEQFEERRYRQRERQYMWRIAGLAATIASGTMDPYDAQLDSVIADRAVSLAEKIVELCEEAGNA
jgi:hypothetical protein